MKPVTFQLTRGFPTGDSFKTDRLKSPGSTCPPRFPSPVAFCQEKAASAANIPETPIGPHPGAGSGSDPGALRSLLFNEAAAPAPPP